MLLHCSVSQSHPIAIVSLLRRFFEWRYFSGLCGISLFSVTILICTTDGSLYRKLQADSPDPARYRDWVAAHDKSTSSSSTTISVSDPAESGMLSQPSERSASGTAQHDDHIAAVTAAPEPAYPASFARIVGLIVSGQPVPGVQPVPDTVLSGHESASSARRRPKPWEIGSPPQSGSHDDAEGLSSLAQTTTPPA
jgi:hypothetical protein